MRRKGASEVLTAETYCAVVLSGLMFFAALFRILPMEGWLINAPIWSLLLTRLVLLILTIIGAFT